MKCWVCSREARGFGITDTRYRIGDARRYPVRWVFCSKRRQDGFHRLYSVRVEAESKEQEPPMIDATEFEQAAIRGCLKAFGEAAGEIGYTKPLGDYTEAEALRVCDAIVTSFVNAMADRYGSTGFNFPPVRGLAEVVQDPFSDFKNDLPWEEGTAQKGGM